MPTSCAIGQTARFWLLWGHNPSTSLLAAATKVADARARGAKLIVIDPRRIGFGVKADCWLRVRPGTDAAIALAIAGIMIDQGWDERPVSGGGLTTARCSAPRCSRQAARAMDLSHGTKYEERPLPMPSEVVGTPKRRAVSQFLVNSWSTPEKGRSVAVLPLSCSQQSAMRCPRKMPQRYQG